MKTKLVRPSGCWARLINIAPVALASVVVLVGCGEPVTRSALAPASAGTLRIISSLPSRGIYNKETSLTRDAIEAAIRVRVPGNSLKVEHVALEGGSDETGEWTAAIEQRNARAAAEDSSVVAYLGPHNSGAAGVALPITSRAGLLQTSPSATWPGLTEPGWDDGEPQKFYVGSVRNFVRLVPPDAYQAWAAADWTARDGVAHVLALHDGSTFSAAMAREFVSHSRSPSPVAMQIDTGAETVSLPPLEGFDAIFFAPSTVQSAARLALSIRGAGVPVYATDVALDTQFLEAAGDAALNWHIVSNGASILAPKIASLFPGIRPEIAASRQALAAYCFTRLVLEAIDAGATDRHRVLDYVRGKTLPDGTHLFDEAGDPSAWVMTGYRIAGGTFVSEQEFAR